MAIAVILQLVAATTYFALTVAFGVLTLSNQYAIVTMDAERYIFLAAGQAMLATWQSTAFNISYILSVIEILIVSAVMLRVHPFSRTTTYAGLSAGVLALVPPTAGTIGMVLSLVFLVPMVIWLALMSRRLFTQGLLKGISPLSGSNNNRRDEDGTKGIKLPFANNIF